MEVIISIGDSLYEHSKWSLEFFVQLDNDTYINYTVYHPYIYSFEKWMKFLSNEQNEDNDTLYFDMGEMIAFDDSGNISFWSPSGKHRRLQCDFSLSYNLIKDQMRDVLLEARERKLYFQE